MAGLGPFDTRWVIPVVDTSLALRGLLAIPLSSRHNQMWFSRALESSPFSVMLQKQTNHFPAGKIGGPKELTSGQRGQVPVSGSQQASQRTSPSDSATVLVIIVAVLIIVVIMMIIIIIGLFQ